MEMPAASFDGAWARFQSRDALILDGDWPARARGRAQQLAFTVRVEDPAARGHLAGISERLAGIPGVDLIADSSWHVTIKGAGFQVIKRVHEDDVLRKGVSHIADSARSIIMEESAFDVQLGLANAFADVAIVEVRDNGRLRRLNTRLVDGMPELHRYPIDGDGYLPHVSVASFSSNAGLDLLKVRLAELRSEAAGPSFPIRRLEFVKAWWIEGRPPEFDLLASYPLSSAR